MGVRPAGWKQGAQALIGLAVLQFALPKLLPLPGVSELWWLFILGGGSWGRLASLVGGTLVAIWGLSLIPSGLGAKRLGGLSALAAGASRAAGAGLALALGAEVRWWPGPGLSPGLLLGLLLAMLFYGGVAYALARLVVGVAPRERWRPLRE